MTTPTTPADDTSFDDAGTRPRVQVLGPPPTPPTLELTAESKATAEALIERVEVYKRGGA